MHECAIINITDTSDELDTFQCEFNNCIETATTLFITLELDKTLSDDLNEHIPFCTPHAIINAISLFLDQS